MNIILGQKMANVTPIPIIPRYAAEASPGLSQAVQLPQQGWGDFFAENRMILIIAFLIVVIIILVGYFMFRTPAKIDPSPVTSLPAEPVAQTAPIKTGTNETKEAPAKTETVAAGGETPVKTATTKQELQKQLAKSKAAATNYQPVVARSDEEILQLMDDESADEPEPETPVVEEQPTTCTYITGKGSRCKKPPKNNGKCGIHADK